MEAIQAGWLSILPPVIAIVLAFLTKEVISSLTLGILSGAVIYAALSYDGVVMVAAKTVETAFSTMGATGGSVSKFNILLFLSLLGALVVVVTKAGGSKAYGNWAANKLRSATAAQLATSALGALIFIDDYFNCLTVGTVMKPVTDKYGISREKLAYIIDATAAPICIIAPVSSWAAAIGSSLSVTGEFESDLAAFVATIPFNFYALLSLVMVIILCITNLDFGPGKGTVPCKTQGILGASEEQENAAMPTGKGRVYDLVIPVLALIIFSILAMLYTGGYFTQADVTTLQQAFGNCDSSASLVMGGFGALLVAFLLFVPRRLLGFKAFMESITEGVKSMASANIILVLAWTLGSICSDVLGTGEYVKSVVLASHFPVAIIPAVIFAVAAFLSFSTGTAWGTFGILIPIVVEICSKQRHRTADRFPVRNSGRLGIWRSLFSYLRYNHPVLHRCRDANHIAHVSTQMPYALLVAVCSFVGYVVAGFTNANLLLSLGSAVVLLLAVTILLHRIAVKKEKASL